MPVTLDNTSSTHVIEFVVERGHAYTESTFGESYTVAAGATLNVTARLMNNAENYVAVYVPESPRGYIASASAFCGRERVAAKVTVGDVDCRNGIVPLTIDNTRSPARSGLFYIHIGSAWSPDTVEARVAEGTRQTVEIPVRITHGSLWIGVIEGDEVETGVYEGRFAVECRTPTGANSAHATPVDAGTRPGASALAETGVANVPLALAGLALLTTGVVLVLLGKGADTGGTRRAIPQPGESENARHCDAKLVPGSTLPSSCAKT